MIVIDQQCWCVGRIARRPCVGSWWRSSVLLADSTIPARTACAGDHVYAGQVKRSLADTSGVSGQRPASAAVPRRHPVVGCRAGRDTSRRCPRPPRRSRRRCGGHRPQMRRAHGATAPESMSSLRRPPRPHQRAAVPSAGRSSTEAASTGHPAQKSLSVNIFRHTCRKPADPPAVLPATPSSTRGRSGHRPVEPLRQPVGISRGEVVVPASGHRSI